jgi:hypothetical protein
LALEEGRQFSTRVAGLFLFLPVLLNLDLPHAVTQAGSCLFSLRLVFVIFGRSSRFRGWTPVTTRMNGFGN